MLRLQGSPYLADESTANGIGSAVKELEDRVALLRGSGKLTPDTLKRYYGQKRFEQVAESNALEGSTLSVGETELVVLKGVTLTGHDLRYVRDAVELDKALQRLEDMARDPIPTDIAQVKELHELILGAQPGAGAFRNEPVRISGSPHRPPKTWTLVMDAMESWQEWSSVNRRLPAVIRAAVLHAWLVHIHPFTDGNGRCARAVMNLELFRAGYPPVIIRKKERDRYIDALSASDEAGDLSGFFDLTISRAHDALTGLELAAAKEQDYSPAIEKIRRAQQRRLDIWHTSVSLLTQIIENELEAMLEPVAGICRLTVFENALDLDDYLALCEGRVASKTWTFRIRVEIPGFSPLEKLAWFGFRSTEMHRLLGGGPSVFWSLRNPEGYPPWIRDDGRAPGFIELTTEQGQGDTWQVMDKQHGISETTTTALAKNIAGALIDQASREDSQA